MAKLEMEKRYNKRHRAVRYNIGDYVLLKRETADGLNNSLALSSNYTGPYRVAKKIGRVSYRISRTDEDGYTTQITAHIRRLRPYNSRDCTALMGEEDDVTPISSQDSDILTRPMISRDSQLSNDTSCNAIGQVEHEVMTSRDSIG
ncbi:hypothetical protein AYI68_g7665 [Smittium mucronatum]|uniref:Tf2-1-like SH3-like domain-containing protein n=1 Tax=Smittium mucronatum TaxID=133383 RepID=A0A1R0GN20_9FUNG|nr:hypothetical protein AYI68_g7665 [Smittium mucronatum]